MLAAVALIVTSIVSTGLITVFRTRRHLHVARQVVARVRDSSGRSFAAAGARNCVRATVISEAAGIPGFKAGRRYRVQLFARASTGARERARFYDEKLTAQRFAAMAPRAPTCGSR